MTDLKLIKEVEKYKEVYGRGVIHTKKRARAWDKICEALQAKDVKTCRTRWRTLRDRFVKMYTTKQLCSESDTDDYEDRWDLYPHLTFLKDHVRSRKIKFAGKSNIHQVEYDNMQPISVDSMLEDSTNVYDDYNSCDNTTQNYIPAKEENHRDIKEYYEHVEVIEIKRQASESPPHVPTSSTRNIRPSETNESEFNDRLLTFMENIHQRRNDKMFDEHDSFLRMVGEKLNELPKVEQDDAKIFFLNHIHNKIKEINSLMKRKT